MDFISPELLHYAEKYTTAETDLLKRLNRETHAKIKMPQMLSGHLQGALLSMISNMIKPKYILEIGTFTGYSAICLAQGLADEGKLHTIEVNDELVPMLERYFNEAGCRDKIELHIGNALQIIPSLKENFDLVFIDADKKNYAAYFDAVIGKVRRGGFILADNVLWSGKVLEDETTMDSDTKAIVAFNKKVHADNRVDNLLLPVRDGLMMMRVK